MKRKLYLALIINVFFIFTLFAQQINITFQNRSMLGHTWTFDLTAEVLSTYNTDWSTMDIRTNIAVPTGATILSVTNGSNLHQSVGSAVGQTNFAGGSVAGTVKYAVALDRVSGPNPTNLTPGTTVILATFSVTFAQTVPVTNLVTPRQFVATAAPSFYTKIGDVNGETYPFGLPVNFPLPIKLTTFSAEQYKERASKLNWSTSSEINSDFFGVERSEDGVNWSNIGRVRAAGNSNETLKYEYIDNSLPLNRSKEQIFYYRLKMTDLDGKYEYSDIRGVNFQRTATTTSISIYPNPSTDRINVDLSGMDLNNGDIVLSVFDMKGQQMIRKNIIGNGLELIDVNQLPAATYNVLVQQKDKVFQQRIIKID